MSDAALTDGAAPVRDAVQSRYALISLARLLWYLGIVTLPWTGVRVLGGWTPSDLILMLDALIVVVCSVLWSEFRPQRQSAWPTAAWIALAVGVFFSATDTHGYSNDNLMIGFRFIYLWLIWRWQARFLLQSSRELQRTIVAFALGAVVSALAAVGQVASGLRPFGIAMQGYGGWRAPGLADHVDHQGGIQAIAIVFLIALLVHNLGRPYRLIAIFATIACVVGLLLSGGVTGMVAGGVALIALMLRSVAPVRNVLLLGLAGGAAFLTANWLSELFHFHGPLERISSTTGDEGGTLQSRLLTWQHAWDHISNSPFIGVGLTQAEGGVHDGDHVTWIHNIFLLSWYQGGLLLLVGLVIALLPPVREIFRKAPRTGVHEAIVCGTVAALVFAQAIPISYQRFFWLPLLLALIFRDVDGPGRVVSSSYRDGPASTSRFSG